MLDAVFTPEQKAFRQMVREFTEAEVLPYVQQWDMADAYPDHLFKRLGELGLLGITVPEEYGGAGRGSVEFCLLMEETSRGGSPVVPMTHVGASCNAIARFGTEEQKRKYLPLLVSGEWQCGYSQTEPGAGSDVAAMTTMARKVGDEWIITGRKQFSSFADRSQLLVLLAQTDKSKGAAGIGVFLVETGWPGVHIERREKKMGMHLIPTNEVNYEEVRVPAANLLVAPGEAFKRMMRSFNSERNGNAAIGVGIAQGALERSLAYAKEREAFGQKLADFQGLRWLLADMATAVEASRLLVYQAAWMEDHGYNTAKQSAMAKVVSNDMVLRVTEMAIQIHGGVGYMTETGIERYYRDGRGLAFGGGTPQILRTRIAHELLK